MRLGLDYILHDMRTKCMDMPKHTGSIADGMLADGVYPVAIPVDEAEPSYVKYSSTLVIWPRFVCKAIYYRPDLIIQSLSVVP